MSRRGTTDRGTTDRGTGDRCAAAGGTGGRCAARRGATAVGGTGGRCAASGCAAGRGPGAARSGRRVPRLAPAGVLVPGVLLPGQHRGLGAAGVVVDPVEARAVGPRDPPGRRRAGPDGAGRAVGGRWSAGSVVGHGRYDVRRGLRVRSGIARAARTDPTRTDTARTDTARTDTDMERAYHRGAAGERTAPFPAGRAPHEAALGDAGARSPTVSGRGQQARAGRHAC